MEYFQLSVWNAKNAKTESHICQGYYCYFFSSDQYPPPAVWALIAVTDYLLTPPESCTESPGLLLLGDSPEAQTLGYFDLWRCQVMEE